MSGGIIIILIIIIGGGFFLYQKYRSGNRGISMSHVKERLINALNRILQSRNHNANERQNYEVPTRTPTTAAGRIQAGSNPNRPLVPQPQDNITETGPMIYFANDRNEPGNSDKEYRFNYKNVNGGWRAYILRMPSLGNRPDASGVIHRLQDSGGYYICWDRQVNTLKDIQNISRHWADSIQKYISTGRFG